MKSLISPSLMCADFLKLGDELKKLEAAGIEYLHILTLWTVSSCPTFSLALILSKS